ncbi:hypothetical protein HDU83_008593 [Entophlyctis luteolus]|nr:hypothetical protein HDU83_008593 [Entophlyctis luteolus]KAJ3392040.1 hypothetical protein HDU84_004968 [Entophlyctis sp. JEL0112]
MVTAVSVYSSSDCNATSIEGVTLLNTDCTAGSCILATSGNYYGSKTCPNDTSIAPFFPSSVAAEGIQFYSDSACTTFVYAVGLTNNVCIPTSVGTAASLKVKFSGDNVVFSQYSDSACTTSVNDTTVPVNTSCTPIYGVYGTLSSINYVASTSSGASTVSTTKTGGAKATLAGMAAMVVAAVVLATL